MTAFIKSYNLFTSLPPDLIREVCEWDTTYKRVFSTGRFLRELVEAVWSTHTIIQQQCERFVRDKLAFYKNRFQSWRTDRGLVHILSGQVFNSKTYEVLDLDKDVEIKFSPYGRFLRFKVVPKGYQTEETTFYDGMFASKNMSITTADLQHMFSGYGNTSNKLRIIELPENDARFVDYMWI
jgi:hypothetical protein